MTQRPLAFLAAVALAPRPALAVETNELPLVWAVDDGTRVRRQDARSPLSRGEGNALWRPGAPIELAALRGETVAFQVIIEAEADSVHGVTVDVDGLTPPGPPVLSIERFVEHYVEVNRRSRNEKWPVASPAWSVAARPPDDKNTGLLPDALIPVALAPEWAPYPLRIAPHETGAVWIDIAVPSGAPDGIYEGKVRVSSTSHGALAALDLRLQIAPAELPYRAVSFLGFYDLPPLTERIGAAPAIEEQLWQLLHAHHVDAFASVRSPDDVERLRAAMDGSLFTAEHGYRGPGVAVAPAAIALGAYGGFGEPTPDGLRKVETVMALLPSGIDDVMLYAVDEDCSSARGPGWRRLARGSRVLASDPRFLVGHTCGAVAPIDQDVDLVVTPAEQFDTSWTTTALQTGKRLWVYNGALPRSGTFMIDSPLTGLMADGWIAASHAVGRWFLWETSFWHDGNRGGKGPIDPFTVAENFHNTGGDACLGDGMLLYPGTQMGRFASRSIGFLGVLPSMRLKTLRRGIQDAGYIALARAASPDAADAIVKATIPAALDELPLSAPVAWSSDGAAFFRARAALRALIPAGASLDRQGVRRTLDEAAVARGALVPQVQRPPPEGAPITLPGATVPVPRARAIGLFAAVLALGALAFAALVLRRRSSSRPPPR